MNNRAFCFDLSGTISKEEIIPLLAKQLGIYDEVQTLTEATVNGEIPPRKSFLLRSDLVNKLDISKSQEIISNIKLNPNICEFIENNNENCFIVTLAFDAWIEELRKKFSCKFFCSQSEWDYNKITNVKSVIDKADVIEQIKLEFDDVVAIGGDMGDVTMLEKADIGIAFVGLHNPVVSLIEASRFVTFSEVGLCNILNTLL